MFRTFLLIFLIASLSVVMPAWGQNAAANRGPWQRIELPPQSRAPGDYWVRPERFETFQLDRAEMNALLRRAPSEALQAAPASPEEIALPMPDGTFARFRFVESPVMAPELAAQFPEIKTYLGQGIDDPAATVRFDSTPQGFHAQILSPRGAVYIDPLLRGDTSVYASYHKRDYRRAAGEFQCLTPAGETVGFPGVLPADAARAGASLRTYRLACAATGEYTQFHGGTVSAGLSAIVTAINRVNGVYETEAAIRLVLVANNNLIVYTNPNTDPYNNSSGSTMLSQNQSNLDSVIGSSNYDIGHVFSTGGGGIAGLGVVCVGGAKARGVTGLNAPVGDPFYIDYVAHEIGHQFGANHTFNSATGNCGGGNRNSSTAYEPGSGSTILAYAGICGSDNLQANSDPYFHSASFDEILAYTTTGSGANCPVLTPTGNTAPVVNVGPTFTIPRNTPFVLTAAGSDPDGDVLTFCWEERDLGPATTLTTADNGSSPLFRSFNPVSEPARVFPRLQTLLNNTGSLGEMLPSTTRTMNFRVTARDNRAGGGGVNTANTQVQVTSAAGPFVVTSPNTTVTWSNVQTVTWNVAGTAGAPVSATNVNILLSTNGGLTFPIVLAANTPNDGSEAVLLPNLTTSAARIKVEGAGNIFFDVSDANFFIVPSIPAPRVVMDSTTLVFEDCAPADGAIDPGETVTLNVTLRNIGDADTTNLVVTLLAGQTIVAPGTPQVYGALSAGGGAETRAFTFTAAGVCGGSITPLFQLQDGSEDLGTLSNSFGLGTIVLQSNTQTNATSISIPATGNKGKANPYPSSISVAGVTGTVAKVTVTLLGLSHSYPADVDVLLVGPSGQNVLLMSDAGTISASGLTLTFDDDAGILPQSGALSSGTYRPTNYDTNSDDFPSPAASGPFGQTLSVFNGTSPNGAWSLYVNDDAVQDTGGIAQGWLLTLTTFSAVCCEGTESFADLAIGKEAAPLILNAGSLVTYALIVTNIGPNAAGEVIVSDALPEGMEFVSAFPSQGSCSNENGMILCALGNLGSGAQATITVVANAHTPGTFTNVAIVSSSTADPNLENNAASASVFVNSGPFISTIADQMIDEDTSTGPIPFTMDDAETPAAGLALTASSSNTNLVPETSIVFGGSDGARTVRITPAPDQSGTTVITLTVSDGMASAATSFLLEVLSVNDAPVLAVIPDFVLDEGDTLTFTNVATDVDFPPDLLTFSLSNAPDGVVIDPVTGVFTWTPAEEQGPGTNLITVIVTDDGEPSLSATQSFTVVVNEVNEAPILAAIADQIVAEGETLIVIAEASDADIPANVLTFSLGTNAPVGASIDPTNGIFTWTPAEEQGPGTNLITILVTDDGEPNLSAMQSFTVVVNEVNEAPILAAIADQVVMEGETLIVIALASDADIPPNALTFSLGTNAPAGASIDPANGIFTWTPTEEQGPGTNLITIIVTDDGEPSLSAMQSFTVVVNEVNEAPVLAAIADQIVLEGETLIVIAEASDADIPPNVLTFSLGTNAPAGASIDPVTGVFTWTPTEEQGPGTNLITIIVTDDGEPSLSATQTFEVIVLESNFPPVLVTIADRTIHAGSTLTIFNSATDSDIPANALVFTLDPGAPPTATIDATNGVLTWVTTVADADTTNHFTVRVTDDGEPPLSDAQSFSVAVVLPPVVQSITVSNGAAILTWNSIEGQTYRLEYNDDLDETNWTELPPDITASGSVTEKVDLIESVPQRFYRVVLVP
jgi:uncharacterized repeat protein (TIGR01451 family)